MGVCTYTTVSSCIVFLNTVPAIGYSRLSLKIGKLIAKVFRFLKFCCDSTLVCEHVAGCMLDPSCLM